MNEKRKINPINLIGGALLIISALFLPWVNIPLLGSGTLLEIRQLIIGIGALGSAFGASEASSEASILGILILLIFLLILFGGFISIFKPKLGGGIGIATLILFTIYGMTGESSAYIGFASGYYIAWIGSVVALFSNKIYEKFVNI